MRRRFADTFYFIALLSEDDKAHGSAVALSSEPDQRIVTTQWVLAELADGFAPTRYRDASVQLIGQLANHPTAMVLPATNEWFDRGMARYGSRPDKEWSLTDCISFLVMEDLDIHEALSGDHHFEQAGFVALLK